jgi:hypothetical protein
MTNTESYVAAVIRIRSFGMDLIALERDALRYRWIRTAGAWESEIALDTLCETPELFDAAVDERMPQETRIGKNTMTDDKRYYMHQCDWVDDTITTDQMIAEIKRMDDGEWDMAFRQTESYRLVVILLAIRHDVRPFPDQVESLYTEMKKTLELGRDGS